MRRWPKRVACTMRAHGAGGGGCCARSVKSWFGRIESKCEEIGECYYLVKQGKGVREMGGKLVKKG